MKSQADRIYRAYKKYREVTNDNTCQREIRAIAKPSDNDVLEVKRYRCYIESDWIEAIEKGLVFVEKAIAEERQFITSEGNVVPIEKIKKVSRESVVHLAKHSNLITHVPDDESKPVIPDSLYMVEKLADYAVYENRFLYMLLYQLKEFISMRLDKIIKIRKKYLCKFRFNNTYSTKLRQYNLDISFDEDREDNPYYLDDNVSSELIKRIEDIERAVISYLKTDIMVEVSKAQMVKPPIVKTNVLKMNNNFKRALELYDFISAYNKDGFTYEEIVTELCPFVQDTEEEFSEIALLISHLTSKHGNDISKSLEVTYLADEEENKRIEAQKLLEQIERVKKRILESNMGYEEYVLLVEKRNKYLEGANEKLIICENKLLDLEDKIIEKDNQMAELNRRIKSLDMIIDDKNNEILELNQETKFKIAQLNDEHQAELNRLDEDFENRRGEIRMEIEAEFEEQIKSVEQELENKKSDCEYLKYDIEQIKQESLENLKLKEDEYYQLVSEHKLREKEFKQNLIDCENNYKRMIEDLDNVKSISDSKYEKEIDSLKDKLNICLAELHAFKTQLNIEINEDFTTREGFNQLEREFEYFYKFFKTEWKNTKKKIRKELLWAKRQGKKDIDNQNNDSNSNKPLANKEAEDKLDDNSNQVNEIDEEPNLEEENDSNSGD